jgi:hypothetical protein
VANDNTVSWNARHLQIPRVLCGGTSWPRARSAWSGATPACVMSERAVRLRSQMVF